MLPQSPAKEIWDILRCCKCQRCVDRETGQIVPEPTDGVVMSHTYCDECKEKAMKEISLLATEEMVKRAARPKPVPPGLSERVRKKTLDHYERGRHG